MSTTGVVGVGDIGVVDFGLTRSMGRLLCSDLLQSEESAVKSIDVGLRRSAVSRTRFARETELAVSLHLSLDDTKSFEVILQKIFHWRKSFADHFRRKHMGRAESRNHFVDNDLRPSFHRRRCPDLHRLHSGDRLGICNYWTATSLDFSRYLVEVPVLCEGPSVHGRSGSPNSRGLLLGHRPSLRSRRRKESGSQPRSTQEEQSPTSSTCAADRTSTRQPTKLPFGADRTSLTSLTRVQCFLSSLSY